MKLFSINRIKKISIISFALAVSVFACIAPIKADPADDAILNQILQVVNTISKTCTSILSQVNLIPTAISNVNSSVGTVNGSITTIISNLINGDTSTETSTLQGLLAAFSTALLTDTNTSPTEATLISTLFPNPKLPVNQADLIYTNILTPNASSAANYIGHVSGIYTPHALPLNLKPQLKANYLSYYNTVMAISSFNAHILSSMGNTDSALNQAQQNLINQAGGAQWFETVATDPIGNILRRMLMFQSQQFLFFNELLKAQKQLLYAQAMTNTLLINTNRANEGLLLQRSSAT